MTSSNIVDFLVNEGTNPNLVSAVTFADLDTTLQEGSFTLFAPPESKLSTDSIPSVYLWNKGYTSDLLLNHVTANTQLGANVDDYTMALGGDNTISASNAKITKIANENLDTEISVTGPRTDDSSNYRIYDVNGLIVPKKQSDNSPLPTLLGGALPSLDTSSTGVDLRDFVQQSTKDALSSLASSSKAFDEAKGYTVFLPTNDAFVELVNEVSSKPGTVTYLNEGGLDTALFEHTYVGGAGVETATYTSLKSNDITVDLDEVTVTIAGENAEIKNTVPTILNNGQVHMIDRVLQFPRKTTVEVAQAATTTLYKLIGSVTGLAETLNSYDKSTVFAPTNEALEPIVCYSGWTDLGENLGTVLKHHVVKDARVYSKDVVDSGKVADSVAGEEIDRADLSLNTVDVLATNGNIHVVDKVLIPPSLKTALPTGYITDLAKAATPVLANYVDLVDGIKAALSTCAESGGYTVFAPSDAAFEGLSEKDIQYLSENNFEKLIEVLKYHVVPVAKYSADLESGELETLNGAKVKVEKNDVGVVIGAGAKVTSVDNKAFNGVVHVIDTVLLPEDVVLPSSGNSGSFTSVSALSTAVVAAVGYLLAL